jgi:hypothetical protein
MEIRVQARRREWVSYAWLLVVVVCAPAQNEGRAIVMGCAAVVVAGPSSSVPPPAVSVRGAYSAREVMISLTMHD